MGGAASLQLGSAGGELVMQGRKTLVRMVSACSALLVVLVYVSYNGLNADVPDKGQLTRKESDSLSVMFRPRHLLESPDIQNSQRSKSCNSYGGSVDNVNCSRPLHHGNGTCDFIKAECSDDVALFNYLAFVACDLPSVKPLGFVILGVWLLYLISLLATTADYFFVPPLNLLARKLRLSPSIAGITLLAIGNGAPDVFTAYSALNNGDMPLVLGALIGASIFISTIVLGTVILVTNVTSKTIDKIDFIRDVLAYIVVVATVIGVAFDGYIHLYEAIIFPILYVLYISIAISISYLRVWWSKRRAHHLSNEDKASIQHKDGVESASEQTPLLDGDKLKDDVEDTRLELSGLTWPRGQNIMVKCQWVIELPFSALRWISIPPCCHDGKWSQWHRWFAVSSPIPMIIVIMIAVKGWAGFEMKFTEHNEFRIIYMLLIIGALMSVGMFFIIKATPPHWAVQSVLGLLAFVMSIAWLNIEANEVVSVLETFGLAFNIDTAILGLTVLAIGNSVGDWVADTAVARAGEPGMGVASCFGSPLLNDVLGLSVALIARIGIKDHGKTFSICIHDKEYVKVKLSWIFLSISLVLSALVFPLFKFSPPRTYGVVLIYIYVVFMVFSVLDEVNILRFNL